MRWIFPAKVNSSIVPRARARPAPSSWAAYDDDEPELPGRGRACGAADRSEEIGWKIAASVETPRDSGLYVTSRDAQRFTSASGGVRSVAYSFGLRRR